MVRNDADDHYGILHVRKIKIYSRANRELLKAIWSHRRHASHEDRNGGRSK